MQRSFSMLIVISLLLGLGITVSGPTQAQGILTARVISNVNMRSGPGEEHTILTNLPHNSPVQVNGRNRIGNWLHVTDPGGVTGWAASRYITWSGDTELGAIPVVGSDGAAPASQTTIQSSAAAAFDKANAWNSVALHLREAPTQAATSFGQLPVNTELVLEGRSQDGVWVLVHTADRQSRGWIAANFLWLDGGITIMDLPLGDLAAPMPPPNTVPAAPAIVEVAPILAEVPVSAIPTGGDRATMEAFLHTLPLVPAVTNNARLIFQAGQALGNRANVFTSAGDCFTDHLGFLRPFGTGQYHLGPHGHLQPTIEYFSASPYEGVPNSWANHSLASEIGYTCGSILDSSWSNPQLCEPNESPLLCEVRLTRPALAIIQFGNVDIQVYEAQYFNQDMRTVVQSLIDRGVVPMLSTFVVAPSYRDYEKSLLFNQIVVQIAQDYDLPLINFWRAAQGVRDYGVTPDGYHPSDDWGNLAGQTGTMVPALSLEGVNSGISMRNLLVLQTLDEMRRNLLGG